MFPEQDKETTSPNSTNDTERPATASSYGSRLEPLSNDVTPVQVAEEPSTEKDTYSATAPSSDTESAPVKSFDPLDSAQPTSAPVVSSVPTAAYSSASVSVHEAVRPETNTSDLTLYLTVLFSGLSVIASASYMVWTALDYFLSKPEGFSLFDFSTFNIYVLIYLVLFGVLNILASLRLEKRVKEQQGTSGAQQTVGAIWRALLIVWGVSAIVGLLYSPLSASVEGGESLGSQITIDVVSAVVALILIVAFFWRDTLLHKVRSALIPTAVVAVLVLGISGVAAFTTLNPKQAKEETPSMYDYPSSSDYSDSSSDYGDSSYDSSEESDYSQ